MARECSWHIGYRKVTRTNPKGLLCGGCNKYFVLPRGMKLPKPAGTDTVTPSKKYL